MSVFKVSEDYKIIINPDAVKLVPEFTSLTEEEMLYVILVADYEDSPFRNKPFDERKSLACKRVWKKEYTEEVDTPHIRAAIHAYKGLVFDIRRETLETLRSKHEMAQREIFRADLTLKSMKEIDSVIRYLEQRIEEIELDLKRTEREQIKLKGETKLSFLEIWQRNQVKYKKFLESGGEA